MNLPNKKIQISLFNEGASIPNYALPQIFDTYFSLPRPSNQQRSSGIGLSIVKQVIEQHHGQIKIENIQANHITKLIPHTSGVLVSIELPL